MKVPKVAIIDHVGLKAGIEYYDTGLYFALKKIGCHPAVFSNFSSPAPEEAIHRHFHFNVNSNVILVFRLAWSYYRLQTKIRKQQIEYCILHGFRFGFWEWMFVRMLKTAPAKILMIIHDPENLLGLTQNNKWRKKIFDSCSRLIVHNNFSRDELQRGLTSDQRQKLAVIPHGNFIGKSFEKDDTKQFLDELGLDPAKKYILFFGQIKETKGLDLLLNALPLTSESINLIIAGRMRKHSFSRYNEIIRANKIEDRVKLFVRYISPQLRESLFRSADLVVLPYRKVFQSGVMLMAMSFGKAVLASDLPPNKELITDNKNGFLFRTGDVSHLASQINLIIRNDRERTGVAEAGYKFVKEQHDWDTVAEKWLSLLNV